MGPWALRGPGHNTDCGREFLARGAQQQAAQREEREREENGEKHLMHETDYSLTLAP